MKIERDLLKSDGVFVLDTPTEVFVWVGKRAPPTAIPNAFKLGKVRLMLMVVMVLRVAMTLYRDDDGDHVDDGRW